MKEQELQLDSAELYGFVDELRELIEAKTGDSVTDINLETFKNGESTVWVLDQLSIYLKQKECEHEDLEYSDREVMGESIYEDFICQECGVKITQHYERPTKKTVEYGNGVSEVIEE